MVSFIMHRQLEPWATLKLLGLSQVFVVVVCFVFLRGGPCKIGFLSSLVSLSCIRQVGGIMSVVGF